MAKRPTKKVAVPIGRFREALGPGVEVERADTPLERALKEHKRAWANLMVEAEAELATPPAPAGMLAERQAAETERAAIRQAASKLVEFAHDALRYDWDRHMLVAWVKAKPKLNPQRARERQMRLVIAISRELLRPRYPVDAATQLLILQGVLGDAVEEFKSITAAQLRDVLTAFSLKHTDERRLAAELTCVVGAFGYARGNEAALKRAIKRFGSFT